MRLPWSDRRVAAGKAGDEAFVEQLFREVLGRPADPDALDHFTTRLARGVGRGDVALEVASSAEHRALVEAGRAAVGGQWRAGDPTLPDLLAAAPDRYRLDVDALGRPLLVFRAEEADDLDWIEARILEHGYYEHDGVWTLEIDDDKRLMAELVGAVVGADRPATALELGCASGAVLAGLAADGVSVVGLDVSEAARRVAPPEISPRIVLGDLLDPGTVERLRVAGCPAQGVDVAFGLDVFEHLNPSRIDDYLGRLAGLVREGGWLVANIPAHGVDPVFGEIHADYLADGHELHRRLHVDDRGYPLHGHLAWATWRWWQDRFEAAGLRRATAVEEGLQRRYGAHLRAHTPARASLFVFRKGPADHAEAALADELGSTPSPLLRAT